MILLSFVSPFVTPSMQIINSSVGCFLRFVTWSFMYMINKHLQPNSTCPCVCIKHSHIGFGAFLSLDMSQTQTPTQTVWVGVWVWVRHWNVINGACFSLCLVHAYIKHTNFFLLVFIYRKKYCTYMDGNWEKTPIQTQTVWVCSMPTYYIYWR